MGLFGSKKKPGGSDDKRTTEEKLNYYISEEESHHTEAITELIKKFLKERLSIDVNNPKIGKEEKIAGFLKLVKSSKVLRQGLLISSSFLISTRETFELSGRRLKYVCLMIGLWEGFELVDKITSGTQKYGYIALSDEYLRSLGTDSYDTALNMIANIHEHDPKSEVDRYLKRQGKNGISAVTNLMNEDIVTDKIRIGKFESFYYTIHDGLWFIDESTFKNKKELIKAMWWLSCAECGVPKELREDLMIQLDLEVDS